MPRILGESTHSYSKVHSRAHEILRMASGRVIGYTTSGPLYLQSATLVILPISVALKNIQELAMKAAGEDQTFYGSQARRAKALTAHWLWLHEIGLLSASIQMSSPVAQLRFLSSTLKFSRSQKRTDGIEPILADALDGAWEWLRPESASYLANVVKEELRRSEFAKKKFDPGLQSSHKQLHGIPTKPDL